MGSQEVVRVSCLDLVIRPKYTKIWLGEGKTFIPVGSVRKMAPILEPHNSVHPRFFQEPDLSRVVLLGFRRMGLEGLP